ncbi:hypothetical protein J6590_065241 [Homalodisca vitripennis]|nr:hypothetical protein J6590_065241 [Homalodisca vitripennis]
MTAVLLSYISDVEQRAKSKLKLRERNHAPQRPDDNAIAKLDSSLKKNTAFVRKLVKRGNIGSQGTAVGVSCQATADRDSGIDLEKKRALSSESEEEAVKERKSADTNTNHKDENQNLSNVSSFLVNKALVGVGGSPSSIRKLRYGSILVEAAIFLSMRFFYDKELKDCLVTDLVRIMKVKNVVLIPTPGHILTFTLPHSPTTIRSGYNSYKFVCILEILRGVVDVILDIQAKLAITLRPVAFVAKLVTATRTVLVVKDIASTATASIFQALAAVKYIWKQKKCLTHSLRMTSMFVMRKWYAGRWTTEQLPGKAVTLIARCACLGESVGAIRRRFTIFVSCCRLTVYVLIMEEDDNVIGDNFSCDEDIESSSNSCRDGEGGVPHPQWATPPQYVALRAHTTWELAPGADDEQTQHGHDVTRSGQRSFRDTLDNPFGYPDSVLGK